jgi:hypothetical protein
MGLHGDLYGKGKKRPQIRAYLPKIKQVSFYSMSVINLISKILQFLVTRKALVDFPHSYLTSPDSNTIASQISAEQKNRVGVRGFV